MGSQTSGFPTFSPRSNQDFAGTEKTILSLTSPICNSGIPTFSILGCVGRGDMFLDFNQYTTISKNVKCFPTTTRDKGGGGAFKKNTKPRKGPNQPREFFLGKDPFPFLILVESL